VFFGVFSFSLFCGVLVRFFFFGVGCFLWFCFVSGFVGFTFFFCWTLGWVFVLVVVIFFFFLGFVLCFKTCAAFVFFHLRGRPEKKSGSLLAFRRLSGRSLGNPAIEKRPSSSLLSLERPQVF